MLLRWRELTLARWRLQVNVNVAFSKASSVMRTSDKVTLENRATCEVASVMLRDIKSALSPEVKEAVMALPEEFVQMESEDGRNTRLEFAKFFKRFGTAFYTTGVLGGRLTKHRYISREAYAKAEASGFGVTAGVGITKKTDIVLGGEGGRGGEGQPPTDD